MGIKSFRPITHSLRYKTVLDYKEELTAEQPYKPLTEAKTRIDGRNNYGQIAVRHRGGGNCSLPPRRKRRSICWTKPRQALRKAWSGKGGDPNRMNEKLLGIVGIAAILALAWLLSSNRKAIRIAGVQAE